MVRPALNTAGHNNPLGGEVCNVELSYNLPHCGRSYPQEHKGKLNVGRGWRKQADNCTGPVTAQWSTPGAEQSAEKALTFCGG